MWNTYESFAGNYTSTLTSLTCGVQRLILGHFLSHLFFFLRFILGFLCLYLDRTMKSYVRKQGGEEVGRGPGNDIRPDMNLCPRGQ